MKIAIIGAGHVGGTLGKRWSENGHDVVYGVRDPSKHMDINAKSIEDSVRDSEIVVLATPSTAAKDAIDHAGNLANKIIIDTTNPIKPTFDGMVDGPSNAEQIAKWSNCANVVKAFNTVGFNIMENPSFDGDKASMLVAGDDAQAKKTAMDLANEIGFEAVDAGPLAQAKYLEDLAWIWISMAMKYGHGREIAFRLMRR